MRKTLLVLTSLIALNLTQAQQINEDTPQIVEHTILPKSNECFTVVCTNNIKKPQQIETFICFHTIEDFEEFFRTDFSYKKETKVSSRNEHYRNSANYLVGFENPFYFYKLGELMTIDGFKIAVKLPKNYNATSQIDIEVCRVDSYGDYFCSHLIIDTENLDKL